MEEHSVLPHNSSFCLGPGSLGGGVVRQQLALRKAQNFILRAGMQAEATARTEYRSPRREALDWSEVYLYHRYCFHCVSWKNVIVKYCKIYLIFWDRYIILESQAPYSRKRTDIVRNK